MMSQPEKIFRDKLENYQRAAPPAAWDRIEQNLHTKGSQLVWLKIAAGVLVLIIAGYFFWSNQLVQPSPTVAITQEPVQKQHEINHLKLPEEIIIPNENINQPVPSVKENPKKTGPQVVQKNMLVEVEKTTEASENVVESNQVDNRIVEPEVNEPVIIPKSTVIIYSADEVNARFLRKKPAPEVTQHETSSGIQKISDLAISIKNNDKGIGDLRQMKDEILTLDFLASNDKRQKK